MTVDSAESAPRHRHAQHPGHAGARRSAVDQDLDHGVGHRGRPGGAVQVHGHQHRQRDPDRDHGHRPEVRRDADSGPSGDTNTDRKLQTHRDVDLHLHPHGHARRVDAGGNLTNTVTADSAESAPDTDTLSIPITRHPPCRSIKSSTHARGDRGGPGGAVHVHGHQHRQLDPDRRHGRRPKCSGPISGPRATPTPTASCRPPRPGSTPAPTPSRQAEIDAGGNLTNTVTVDSAESAPDTDTINIPITQAPALQVVKSSTHARGDRRGSAVPYTFTVTNTGNLTLTGVTVTDPKCSGPISGPAGDANTDGKLQTTETWIYTCTHTVTPGRDRRGRQPDQHRHRRLRRVGTRHRHDQHPDQPNTRPDAPEVG